jgi:hypothetical protein
VRRGSGIRSLRNLQGQRRLHRDSHSTGFLTSHLPNA